VIAQPPPNEGAIRALAAAGLHEKAASELRYAQRVWGDSPAIRATLSWVSYEQGIANAGSERYSQLRGSITMMRRAYPQFLAAGGEQLPREVLAKIFPLAYWDPIRRYSSTHNLDPYLMAALMAQESTFVADVRSAANAVGLMQLIPSTARRMATKLGMRYSSRLLIDPDANMRMGMAYFADKIKEFGAVHLALASYNAGETPVRRWIAERPGLPVDEFIDDIPYAETQNYVKRIIGTAEDYRRLYGQ
jgi:soluble lytic murein transglycosylase